MPSENPRNLSACCCFLLAQGLKEVAHQRWMDHTAIYCIGMPFASSSSSYSNQTIHKGRLLYFFNIQTILNSTVSMQ